jgi:hypothetical protein
MRLSCDSRVAPAASGSLVVDRTVKQLSSTEPLFSVRIPRGAPQSELNERFALLTGQSLPVFLSAGMEFAYVGEDFGESVCESIEVAGIAIWERTAQHQQEMLSDEQGVDEPVASSVQRSG